MVTGVCRLHKWSFVRIHDLLSKIRMCDQVQEGQLQQYFSKSRFLEILWQFRGESDHYMLRCERRLVEIGLLWRSGIGVGLKGSVGFREKKYRENGTAIWGDYAGSLKEVFVELPCVLRIFPGRAVVKNLHANAGDVKRRWFDPWVRKILCPLQYSCLENPMDRGAWWATVHGVSKNRTWLKQLSTHVPHVLRMWWLLKVER